MDSITTDLSATDRSLSSQSNDRSQEYRSKTLTLQNQARLSYLPIFPAEVSSSDNPLLLANVSGLCLDIYIYLVIITCLDLPLCLAIHLTASELTRRLSGTYPTQESTAINNYQFSSTDELCLSQEDAEEMAQRLQVDISITTFNAIRLRNICNALRLEQELYRRNVLEQLNVPSEEPQFQSEQMVSALEFFLQMDGK